MTDEMISLKYLSSYFLCGSIQIEYDPFQYMITGVWEQGIEISSPSSLAFSYVLKELDLINLHVAFKWKNHFYSKGCVQQIRSDQERKDPIFQVGFVNEFFKSPVVINLDMKESNLEIFKDPISWIIQCVNECILLKKGVAVYLKHLNAYFSRVIGYHSKKYPRFSAFFFETALLILLKKIDQLQKLKETLSQTSSSHFFEILNLQEIFEIVESEVNLDILNLAFKEVDQINLIVAIKELEEKLYWNYNQIVLISEAGRREVHV